MVIVTDSVPGSAAPWTNSADAMAFFGKVAEWLKTEPEGKVSYGEFYVSSVTLSFDGEVIGRFVSEDPSWEFVAAGPKEVSDV